MLVLLHGLIPILFLGAENGTALGFVLAASTVIGYAATMQNVAQRVGFPSLARLELEPKSFQYAVQRSVSLSTFIIVATAVPLGALSPIWLPALFGTGWDEAVFVTAWVAAATVLQSVMSVATAALNAEGRTRSVFVINLASTVSYVALAAALIGHSQLLAIPLALAGSRCVGMALSLIPLRHALGKGRLLRSSVILSVAAGCAPAAAWLTTESVGLGLGATLAASVGWLSVNRSELAFLWRSSRGG